MLVFAAQLEKTTRVVINLQELVKQNLECLLKNRDVFAWLAREIMRVSLSSLSIDLMFIQMQALLVRRKCTSGWKRIR